MIIKDVPSPIDLRNKEDAEQWEKEAAIKRPWRSIFTLTISKNTILSRF